LFGRPSSTFDSLPSKMPQDPSDDLFVEDHGEDLHLFATVRIDWIGLPIDQALWVTNSGNLLNAVGVIECYHVRGFDELVHRPYKIFVDQWLPFKGFRQNTAYYYMTLLVFVLFEAFKATVTDLVVPETAYATTFQRRFIDVATNRQSTLTSVNPGGRGLSSTIDI